jgi:hypothetical protein
MAVVPHPFCIPDLTLYDLFLFLLLKIPRLDTVEVIEVKSQAVLNILIEHDFKDAFKDDWEQLIRSDGDYLKSDGDQ